MTDTNAPLLLRPALGLLLAGSLVSCAPPGTTSEPEEGPPPATSPAATVEVEVNRRELPGGGEVSLDAQWQSLDGGRSSGGGGGGSTGDDGGDGGSDGGVGGNSDEDFCDAALGDCAYYIFRTDVGVDMTAAELSPSAEIGTLGISGAQADAFTILENTCTGLEVSRGTATCSITVELVAQEPGLYRAQLAINIPSHEVTETVELVREVRAPATALPTEPMEGTASAEPTEEITASAEPLEPVPTEATVPATVDPPLPPAPVPPSTASPTPGPPEPQAPAPAVPVEGS